MHLYGLSSVRVSTGLQSPYNTKSVNRYAYKELGGCNIWFESLFESMFHGHMYLDNNRSPTQRIKILTSPNIKTGFTPLPNLTGCVDLVLIDALKCRH